MNKTTSSTKLSKSLLLGASATFLYTITTNQTANAMFRPISKIPNIYRTLLSTSKTNPQSASSILTLGSSSIGNQNQNSLASRPLNNPLTPIETSQPQGNTNLSGNRPLSPYSGMNTNSSTGANPNKNSPTSPTGGQIITSNSINKPSLGVFVAHRLENFKDSSTNNQNSSINQPNSIVPTGYVANLKSNFETNNKTSRNKINSNNIQYTSLKNQGSNLNQGKGNTSPLVAKFYDSTPETPQTQPQTPPRVSELKKNFEYSKPQPSTSSTSPTSTVSSLAKSFGGTVQQNKQKEQATQNKNSVLNLRANFESGKPKTQSLKKNSQGGENVTSLIAKLSGTAPKTPDTPEEPTSAPPKVSELKKIFEAPITQPDTNQETTPISVRNLAKTFENSNKQQPKSPSQKNVKTLAKNFGGIKGGNKNNSPRQLTYEEMIK